ncbi:hypothetical protein Tco_0964410 [Tanacetum coccineum]
MSIISSDSMAESVGSSASHMIVALPVGSPVIALVMDFESDPFKDPPYSKPFEDRASPTVTADSEIGAEPLASPDTSDYYGGSEFSEECDNSHFQNNDNCESRGEFCGNRADCSPTKQQKDKLVENASNKRNWEGDHNGIPSQHQSKEHKVFRAHTVKPINKKNYAGNLPL